MNGYAITVLGVYIIGAMVLLYKIDNDSNIEMAKSGLQQCVVKNGFAVNIVWQKECDKTK
jgi:hypothetical protein